MSLTGGMYAFRFAPMKTSVARYAGSMFGSERRRATRQTHPLFTVLQEIYRFGILSHQTPHPSVCNVLGDTSDRMPAEKLESTAIHSYREPGMRLVIMIT